MSDIGRFDSQIRSFTCRCLVKDGDAYLSEPSAQMFSFFGTTSKDYESGIVSRIRRDISEESANKLENMIKTKADKLEDFRLIYPTVKADGSDCMIQLDAYYEGKDENNNAIYNTITVDMSELVEIKRKANSLSESYFLLTEDSPVGIGLYHIKDNVFDLVYTNEEYYRVHCGSKEFWDKYEGSDAIERIYESDRHLIYEKWDKIINKHEDSIFDLKYRCLGEDNKLHWIRIIARLSDTLDENGMRSCYATYLNVDADMANESGRDTLFNVISNLPSISALYSLDNGVITVESFSQEFAESLGYSDRYKLMEKYLHKPYDAVHPDDVPMARKLLSELDSTSNNRHCTYRIITSKGKYKWYNVTFSYFEMNDKKYFYLVYTDIDDIKRMQYQTETDYANAQKFMDSVTDKYLSTMRVNLSQNKIESCNGIHPLPGSPTAVTYDEVVNLLTSYVPSSAQRDEIFKNLSVKSLLQSYSKGNRKSSVNILYREPSFMGSWIKIEINMLLRPGTDDVIGFVTVENTDLEHNLNILTENVLLLQYDCIYKIDSDSRTITLLTSNNANSPISNIKGQRSYNEFLNIVGITMTSYDNDLSCYELLNLNNVISELDKKGTIGYSFNVFENRNTHFKRTNFYYLDNESRTIALIISDYTEEQKKQLDQEDKLRSALTAAQKANAAKSEFLSHMSHEIRTPLNAIIGIDTIALSDNTISELTRSQLTKIGVSANFLLSLINDILDMSMIESGRMILTTTEFDFRQFVESINTILAAQCKEKGITYDCIINGFADELYIGDRIKLQQVLINILGNAVKFTPSGGKIQMIIDEVSRDNGVANLKFTIADTGCGIDEAFLPHIFDTFAQESIGTTSTYSGSGLGLAISKSLIKLMNGSIKVRSAKRMGSSFTVELSMGVSENAARHFKYLPGVDVYSLNALVIDNDITVCQHLDSVLAEIGIKSVWVLSIKEAEKLIYDDRFNLIIIDSDFLSSNNEEVEGFWKSLNNREIITIASGYERNDYEDFVSRGNKIGAFMLKPVFPSSVVQAFQRAKNGSADISSSNTIRYNFSGNKVLLAEDNEINREIAKNILEMSGFEVSTAVNGSEAVSIYSASSTNEFSAIIMDIRMPLMDGLEATRRIRGLIRSDSKSIPIIAMSANAFDEDVRKSLQSGMNAHLSKPIDINELYKTLNTYISSSKKF